MKRRTKRLIGTLALAAGTLGAAGAFLMKKKKKSGQGRTRRDTALDVWARPGMNVTFRAELMPSRETSERTFRVAQLLPSGRVTLEGVAGEHNQKEFEPHR
ncbi:MAG: hypothetical protein QOD00_2393 [Blastocatellia bacterium]|jgi:hypothetical protein|nr:hypothetical protein [Blastocatellia bacterium]